MPNILQKSTIKMASAPHARHTPNQPRAPIPAQQKKEKAAEREARQDEIDALFEEWIADTHAKANTYAERFGKKPRYFLNLFFHGGARMVHQHEKINAHNAFLSLKSNELRDRLSFISKSSCFPVLTNPLEGEVRSLLDIQSEFKEEYHGLSKEEQEEVLREYKENHSSSSSHAPRISPRACIQDFANTERNIKMLLNGLKLRVGIEGFYCIVRNTTTYHTPPKWFFTSPELEKYMKLASKNWSLHNVGTKIEAFAIAGCDPISKLTVLIWRSTILTTLSQDMCNTSKKKADYYKMAIRDKIQGMLVDITGNPNATMQYARYEQDIVQRYGIVLEGWTYENFVNPSELSTSIPALCELHDALTNGTCRFVKLTAAQKKEREVSYQAKISAGEIVIPKRKKRADAGKQRKSRKRSKATETDSGHRSRNGGNDGDESDDSGHGSDGSQTAFMSRSVVNSDAE